MFKLHNPTEQEKLLYANGYIKELKKQLRTQERTSINAVDNLRRFIDDVRASSQGASRLISYKLEMQSAHKKSKKLEVSLGKMEHKNYLLRQKIRGLQDGRTTDNI
jgi:hypothetical protein